MKRLFGFIALWHAHTIFFHQALELPLNRSDFVALTDGTGLFKKLSATRQGNDP
jgi:hypothetical protein